MSTFRAQLARIRNVQRAQCDLSPALAAGEHHPGVSALLGGHAARASHRRAHQAAAAVRVGPRPLQGRRPAPVLRGRLRRDDVVRGNRRAA